MKDFLAEPFPLVEKPVQWRIGRMARFFDISVQTLHHYDRIGLFQPDVRDPYTDYRYYSYQQVYRLANIVFLKKQGYSLQEIKEYIEKASIEGRLEDLQKQANHLQQEVIKLASSSKALEDRLAFILANDYPEKMDIVEIVDAPAFNYVKIGREQHLFPSELFYFFPTIVHYKPKASDFGAYVIDIDNFMAFISSEPTRDVIQQKIEYVPSSRIIRGYFKGPYDRIDDKIAEMRVEADVRGFSFADYSIHFNIIDQFVARDPSDYITEIHLPVVEKEL